MSLFVLVLGCKKNKDGDTVKDEPLQMGWSKAFGGTKNDLFYSFASTPDGAYIVTGIANSNDGDVSGNHGMSDAWVFKTDRSGNILWQKAIGGTENDEGWSVIANTDNTYVMAGATNSNDGNISGNHGGQDILLVKLGTNGNILWQKALGGSGYDFIVFSSLFATADGGYMMVGNTMSNNGNVTGNHGGIDYWLVKLDGSGNVIWQKTFGGSKDDISMSINPAVGGGYILAGQSNSNDGDVSGNHGGFDAWLVKVDDNGNKLWQKTYGGSGDENGYLLKPTKDGGYIMSGETTSSNNGDVQGWHGDQDAWVVKLNAAGSIVWQKPLGSSQYEDNYCVTPTEDGGYLVAALTNGNNGDVSGNHGGYDAWFVKLNGNGNIVWQKTYGGTGDDNPTSFLPTVDGGYIYGGQTTSTDVKNYHGELDAWLFTLKNP